MLYICTDGTFLPPLFITARATVDLELYDILHNDQLNIATQKNGFMDAALFAKWLELHFEKKRQISIMMTSLFLFLMDSVHIRRLLKKEQKLLMS